MKMIICDNCGKETIKMSKPNFYSKEVPPGWIHIDINRYYNKDEKSGERRIVQTSGEFHFCSKECFINSFFFTQEEIKDNKQ